MLMSELCSLLSYEEFSFDILNTVVNILLITYILRYCWRPQDVLKMNFFFNVGRSMILLYCNDVVTVTRSLVLYVCFVDCCLSFCPFSFGHCVVCSSSIYGFWLPLWYLQAFLRYVCGRYLYNPSSSTYLIL